MFGKSRTLSKALFGGELIGDCAVRYVYVDEAGTSVHEPVTVVVGIIVHADRDWKSAEAEIGKVLALVPKALHRDFVFHAKTVWGSKKYREIWSMSDRLSLLHSMMQIPRKLEIPVSLAMVRRDTEILAKMDLPKEAVHHLVAFYLCLTEADRYIREHAEPNEVATVVAEDVPSMRKTLRKALDYKPIILPVGVTSGRCDIITKDDREFRISRVIDTVHFVEKGKGPLLQIADACAFGFRRYFSNQQFGKEFVRSILGYDFTPVELPHACLCKVFSPHDAEWIAS
jgi:hypothetical protein